MTDPKKSIWQIFKDIPELGVLIALFLICLFFATVTDAFLTTRNFLNLMRQVSAIGVMTIAMTILITSQEFDLSVGSLYALTGIIVGLGVRDFGLNIWLAALICLLIAAVIGVINGLITVKLGIPSFITTLGMMMFYRGVALVISGGRPVSGLRGMNFNFIFGGRLGRIPMQVFWLLLFAILGYLILQRAKFGYKVYATGGNKEAAEISGINTDKVKIICFIFTAVSAGIASFFNLAFLGSVSPTQGEGFELQVIAASVVGGTYLFGGKGTILGGLIGAVIMTVVRNGLVLMGTTAYLQQAMIGVVVVIAVVVNIQLEKLRAS